ncbi:MAG TPA: hypothetical protein VLG47_02190 [Candidatus Saccharimonadales bacterium]|nr:hypothetical protein [Candidatus Saccharimonadales bacterium]
MEEVPPYKFVANEELRRQAAFLLGDVLVDPHPDYLFFPIITDLY